MLISASPSDANRRLSSSELEYARPSSVGEEEIQLQLALAMSKEEHDETVRTKKHDDIKLHLAMEESKKEADDVCIISMLCWYKKTILFINTQNVCRINTLIFLGVNIFSVLPMYCSFSLLQYVTKTV